MWTAEVMRGIGEALHQRHHHLLLYGYRDSDDPAPGDFLDGRVDGLIVIAPHEADSLVGRLGRYRMPTVVIGGRGSDSDTVIAVDVDNEEGAAQAVRYLASLGHRRIAHLRGPLTVPNANDRANGFVKECQALGMPDAPVFQAGFDTESGFNAAMMAIRFEPRPTALFACNDVAALGAMRACSESGLRVPEDISIFGYDDAPVSQLTNPRLTTMRQPANEMGQIAAEYLLNHRDTPPEHRAILVSAELIPRESTAQHV
jgi:LacI family transcriptional regulator